MSGFLVSGYCTHRVQYEVEADNECDAEHKVEMGECRELLDEPGELEIVHVQKK